MTKTTRILYILPAVEHLSAVAFAEVGTPQIFTHKTSFSAKGRAIIDVIEVPFVNPPHPHIRGVVRGQDRFFDCDDDEEAPWAPEGILAVAYAGRYEAAAGTGQWQFGMDFELGGKDGKLKIPESQALSILRGKILEHLRGNRNLCRRQSTYDNLKMFSEVEELHHI